jgi:4-diphosphocytidyl-2-C-methyl-D-erythritol kinase
VLEIEKKKEPGIVLTTNIPYVPTDERNLVYKAAKMLMDEFDIKEGLTMNLEKFIPVAAGMAGGSSDAAAAFVGVNRLFGLGLSFLNSTIFHSFFHQTAILHHFRFFQ